jgi:hypothetical protein
MYGDLPTIISSTIPPALPLYSIVIIIIIVDSQKKFDFQLLKYT